MEDIILELKGISKKFGHNSILKNISIQVKKGEFISLLGSSGCGKTTTLRIIAGLETPDAGNVYLHGKDITNCEPNKREVNTVFQSYALFPHMTVAQNVGYGLKIKKVDKNQIKKRVSEVLNLVMLQGFEDRKPSELSGGQRQRVAIARAIINQPDLLLLDEPLGALDYKLRRQMQQELKQLQKKLGITFIYITHDQEEAINMSSRIAIMKDGEFLQIGTPDEIYYHPKTSYIATFVGDSNVIKATVVGINNKTLLLKLNEVQFLVEYSGSDYNIGDIVTLAVRREHVKIDKESIIMPAKVIEKSFSQGMLHILFELTDGQKIAASQQGINYQIEIGDVVSMGFSEDNVVIVKSDQELI